MRQFNRGLIAHPEFKDQIDRQQNSTGLYRIEFSKMFFSWIGGKPKFPRPPTMDWKNSIVKAGCRAFAAIRSTVRDQAEIESALGKDETPAKRPWHEVSVPTATPAQIHQASVPTVTPAQIQQARDRKVTPEQIQQTYFDSPDAVRLFFPTEDDESVLACIERKIELFEAVGDTTEGWRLVIDGGDPDDLCSSNDVFEIRNRCALLCQAYMFAQNHMSVVPGPGCRRWKWSDCCDAACKHLNPSGNR